MAVACSSCGNTNNVGRFCPACGAQQPASTATSTSTGAAGAKPATPEGSDPLLGRIIGERYEIQELINVGGMGRVYRGLHRALDRPVAIKLIHPHLLTSDAIVSRFMVEARTASRLNHPNVVSIFDFGRTGPTQDDRLFLVMELLTGPDLATVLERSEPMPFARVAEILRQTLAALAQAHALGITHRDIKPENIILEPGPDGTDLVKVIDFGIAKIEAEGRLTQAGQLLGTPYFMAPEQIRGGAAAPSFDLYAVGVMLFQMLTRRMPFDGANAGAILQEHLFAPRPDPRKVAPEREIPDALAEVCLRALAADPASRYRDARALAEAIAAAVGAEEPRISRPLIVGATGARAPTPASLGARPASRPSILGRAVTQDAISVPAAPRATTPQRPLSRPGRHTSSPPGEGLPLTDRDAELVWGRALLEAKTAPPSAVLYGPPGAGRSRLLSELAGESERAGVRVMRVSAQPSPMEQCGYLALRAVLAALSGREPADLARVADVHDVRAAEGLREAFGTAPPGSTAGGYEARKACLAALEWAAQQAVESARGRALLALDDVDRFDTASRLCVSEFLRRGGTPGLTVLMTAAQPLEPQRWGAHTRCEVRSLPREKAAALMGPHATVIDARALPTVEPLYVALALRWRVGEGREEPPTLLEDLIAWKLRALPPAQTRVLQAVALSGGGTIISVAALLARPEEMDAALRPLGEAGLVEVHGGVVRVPHQLVARAVLDRAAPADLQALHARAADANAEGSDRLELRAYHALRGRADFESFLLVEQAARLRQTRGDEDGALAALWDGIHAARREMLRGDNDSAQSACVVFGRKLGGALISAGRAEEAQGVLTEVLELTGPGSAARALVLEQLAGLEQLRGRFDEAVRRQREAQAIAERLNDAELLARLKRPMNRPLTGARRPATLSGDEPGAVGGRARTGRVSDVVVRNDARAEPEDVPGASGASGAGGTDRKDRG